MDNSILSGNGGSGKKTKVMNLNPKAAGKSKGKAPLPKSSGKARKG